MYHVSPFDEYVPHTTIDVHTHMLVHLHVAQNTIDHAWSHNAQHIDGQAWPIQEQTKDTPLTLLDISDDTHSLSLSIQHNTKYYIVLTYYDSAFRCLASKLGNVI